MKKLVLMLLCAACCGHSAQGKDMLVFGDKGSECAHVLEDSLSEAYEGLSGETARRLLPGGNPDWQGGWLRFKMRVSPDAQNYFSVECDGGEADETMVLLFIEGKQIGYRHLGDYDLLHYGNGGAPCPGKSVYYTLPLPRKFTDGKQDVELELRAYGKTWGYASKFEQYQKKMDAPSIGFYRAYVGTKPCLPPERKERRHRPDAGLAPVRPAPGAEVLDRLKEVLSGRIRQIMEKSGPLGQQEIWLLADAWGVRWTPAFQNKAVADRIVREIDGCYRKFWENPRFAYGDAGVYNPEWMTTCMLARSIRRLWAEMEDSLETRLPGGVTRRKAWADMLKASVEYACTHRRQYTNQSMIIDMAMYECNRALMLLDARMALPEYQTLRYLYESLSLAPWLGKETGNGPEKPLGDDYWQLTAKGLTKELGYVGYYGEVVDWVVHIYEATSMPGVPFSGDEKIKAQLLRIAGARYPFRYPAVDADGYRCFRAEAVVGWRDSGHYPADVMYGDRGAAWDATPLMTATATLDPLAVGIAQQMLADNQFFAMVESKLKDNGIRTMHSCLHIPDQYELVSAQPPSAGRLPMSAGAPDFVFADEEDGVVAVKNGDEIFYVSLYWRARYGVNNLAKVHFITSDEEQVANVCIKTSFEDSGLHYVRPDWVNFGFSGWAEWYEGLHSAHAGEELPIAKIPGGLKFKPGDEHAYAGRADYYLLRFGRYTVAMNASAEKTFEVEVPQGGRGTRVVNLADARREVAGETLSLPPRSTVVFYVEDK